jgi:RNA polymerase sigma-70 factor (ECF subfamily)
MGDNGEFADFIRRLRTGDPSAAESLVRQYESAIRVVLKARLTDPAVRRQLDAEDVCQSVLASFFLRAASGQYDLDEPAQLTALLMAMARNKLAEQLRKAHRQRRDTRRQGPLQEAAEVAESGAGPATLVANRDLLERLRARLSPEERDLADRRSRGEEWAAIAAALGGTAQGRRKQLERALDRAMTELGIERAERD